MNELIDEVHRLGMKFGLWIEPEMVNPKSRLFSKHPEWVLSYPNREILMGRNQYELDMANPEVVDYLIQVLDELLSENAIDYIKWDMNRYLSEAGSPTREPRQWKELHFRSTEGVYRLAEELKKRHPKVELEACASGGGRGGLRARWSASTSTGPATTQIRSTGFSSRKLTVIFIPSNTCGPGSPMISA